MAAAWATAQSAPVPGFAGNTEPRAMTTGCYRLLGAECSYYTAKIRAYLLQRRLPFVDVLATRAIFRDEILPRVGWPVIPVLITPEDETLQDTSDMIDALEARHRALPLLPATPVKRVVSLLFELYADEWIKLPALYYRWHYDRDFAIAEFGRNNDPERDPAEQRRIGEKIARPFEGWLGPLGVSPATIPAIEAEYLALLAAFDRHFAATDFLLGRYASLGDCALYGPFHAHLYRDPNSGAIMRRHAPHVVAWLDRMQHPGDVDPAGAGDALPDSLVPILGRLSRDYVPVLSAQVRAFQHWLASHPDTEIPRQFGTQAFTVGRDTPHAATGTRALFSYDQWMLQRVLDAFDALEPSARRDVRAALATFGAAELLDLALPQRVTRRAFRLVRAA
jgi:glutathione S-transferase